MDQRNPVQAGSLLLPPAANWFCSGSIDSREEDRLLVAGAFKNIVIYKIPLGSEAPTVLKSIYHAGPKVLHVRLFPDASHQRHGPSLLATSDVGGVTLYNAETGVATLQHNEHGAGEVHGVCWSISSSSNEVSAVSVGAGGTLVVWDVDLNVTRKVYINPSQRSNVLLSPQPDVTLTLVEAVPGVDNAVVVAAQKVIVIVDIKSGRVLSQLRGHDHPVYCLQWWTPTHPTATSPFPHPRPVNARAEALRDNDEGAAAAAAKEPESSSVVSGRYFASSDLGGSVLLWDVDRRRYVYRTQVSSSTHKGSGRGYRSSSQHCALAWHDNELLTNTVAGAIISLPLSENSSASCVSVNESSAPPQQKHSDGWRSGSSSWRSSNVGSERKSPVLENGGSELRPKVIHREHSRVVFNLHVIGSTLVSCGHDRNLIGYSLDINKVQFSLPTLGGSVHSIAFDPRDSSWLALGSQEDCIRLIKLNSSPPLRSKVISNGIRGKVLALSWHPKEDGFLLYGTSEGQVGIANVNTAKVIGFSFFHQKPVYKVEWAPAVLANEYPDYAKAWCAYSFGDREIAMRNPNAPMADAVKLSKVSAIPGHASEFSFSHDHKYFAVGCQDGSISVYRSADLAALVKIVVVRKTIQHLLWKPFSPSGNAEQNIPYVLAVASSESRICLLDLTNTLPEQSNKFDDFQVVTEVENDSVDVAESAEAEPDLASWKPLIVSTCTRELCGHSGRIVYLSFSVCEPDLLASASYDHTCQVWDSNSGEQIGNYRAHLSRLYRVEFSPSEPGLLFSFGEENCVHQWKLADLKEKSPPEKVFKVKDSKPKLAVAHGNEDKCVAIPPPSSLKSSETKPKNAKHTETSSAVTASRRVPTHKSLFPLLHQASCHKRSFNLLSVLCLDEQSKLVKEQAKLANEVTVEQIIAASETGDDDGDYPYKPLESASVHYGAAVDAVGDAVFDADDPAPPEDDLKTFVDFYGPTLFTRQFLSKQIDSHLVASNFGAAAPLELWCGTSDSLLRSAIAKKSVTPDLVVQAMYSSRQSGVLACAAYARQLVDAGDPLTASSYFIMANMDLEAIELLQQHKLYREALILAKARRPCSSELQENIARSFAGHCMHEGNLDIAAVLLASVGDAAEAASMLCRRGDPASLTVGGLLYSKHGHALADVTLLEALRTAGYRGQLDKVLTSVLKVAPQYRWFSLIAATVREITALFAAVKAQSSEEVLISSKSKSSDSVSQDGAPDGKTERSDSSSTIGVPDEDSGVETRENMSDSKTPTEKEASCTIEDEGETCDHRSLETRVNGVHTASASSPGLESCSTHRVLKRPANNKFFVSSEDGEDEDVMQRIISVWPRELRTSEAHAAICSALSVSLKPSTLKQYVFLLSVELTKMLLCLDACFAAVKGDTAAAHSEQDKEHALDVEAAATALHSALQLAIDWNRFDQLFDVTHMLLPKGVDEPPAVLSPLFNYGPALTPHSAVALLCKLYRLTEHAHLDKTSSNPHAPKESLKENATENIHDGLDATGEDSSEVKSSSEATVVPDQISSDLVSCELKNGGSCGDEMVSLAREVAESCGAGDDAKVKRIFDDISFLLCNVKIQ